MCWHHRPPPIKYTSSCREDQRLSAEGKIVPKYCVVSKTQEGSITPPPPPPTLYHGGDMTLRVHLKVKLTVSTRSSKLDSRFSKPFNQCHNATERCVTSLYTDVFVLFFSCPPPPPRCVAVNKSPTVFCFVTRQNQKNTRDSNESSFESRKTSLEFRETSTFYIHYSREFSCLQKWFRKKYTVFQRKETSYQRNLKGVGRRQEGCRSTDDLLFTDNLKAMLRLTREIWQWQIDRLHWIEDCLNIFGIAEDIKRLLCESMKSWRTELTSGSNVFGEVQIQRGTFLREMRFHPSCWLLQRCQ